MLDELLRMPADLASLGARMHSILAREQGGDMKECFRRDDWTCHRCGFRFAGFMEIDHTVSHDARKTGGLRTICQFCHNLRHPVWSDLRGRLRMIWAPSLPQESLNRMAWLTMLASEDSRGNCIDHELADAAREIVAATRRRESIVASILGTSHPGGLFEAMFAVRPLCAADRRMTAIERIGQFVRFWPVAADRIHSQPAEPSSSFSCWDGNRFTDISGMAVSEYWKRERTVQDLRRVCAAHQAEIDA